MSEERQQRIDDMHRAVGRYIVEFSRLMFHMKSVMILRLSLAVQPAHQADQQQLAQFAFGEAMAAQIANGFFGMCRFETEFDPDEKKVYTSFRNAVSDAIEKRNYFAHGDWWVGWGDATRSHVSRLRPVRAAGAHEGTQVSAAELDEESDSLIQLRHLLVEFGNLCLLNSIYVEPAEGETARVRDIFVVEGGKVVRNGPKAALFFPFKTS